MPTPGRIPAPEEIRAYRLQDGGTSVTLLNLGAITQDWRVDGRPVVLGYADPSAYLDNPMFLGVIAGRVANRISAARFELGGETWVLAPNEGPNMLHGGPVGTGRQLWQVERDGERALRLVLDSPHLDQGFPGALRIELIVTLEGRTLTYDMRATPDRETPVSLAQHNYYTLSGGTEPVWDHRAHVPASRYVAVDDALLPTGALVPVAGQPFDLRQERSLGEADPDRRGSDISHVFDAPGANEVTVTGHGLRLRMEADKPGLQFYTGGGLAPRHTPLPGQSHARFHGLCLEPQGLPDAVTQPAFPSILCTPEAPYRQVLRVTIAPQ
ncbi:galactose mutarotase [Aquicoccus sp. SCR17]|nr:galactose mutarotase [Carideicomes alvinocaridis]